MPRPVTAPAVAAFRDRVCHAAADLFAEKGFEGTSIRDLATKADVNVAMINYYFGSKEKLFECMVKHKAAYTKEFLEEIVNNGQLSEIEKIDRIIDSYVSRLLVTENFTELFTRN